MLSTTSYCLVKIQVTTKRLLFFLLVLGIISSCKEKKPPQVTFDVPALFKMNIDEVRKVLGKPLYHPIEPSNPKEEIFENQFEKNGETLFVDFNTKSREIIKLSIFPSEDYDNLEDIMKIGNLDATNVQHYHVEGLHPILSNTDLSGIDIYIK